MINMTWGCWTKIRGKPVLRRYNRIVNHGDLFTVPKHSRGRLGVEIGDVWTYVDAKEGDVLRVYELGVIKETEDAKRTGV